MVIWLLYLYTKKGSMFYKPANYFSISNYFVKVLSVAAGGYFTGGSFVMRGTKYCVFPLFNFSYIWSIAGLLTSFGYVNTHNNKLCKNNFQLKKLCTFYHFQMYPYFLKT